MYACNATTRACVRTRCDKMIKLAFAVRMNASNCKMKLPEIRVKRRYLSVCTCLPPPFTALSLAHVRALCIICEIYYFCVRRLEQSIYCRLSTRYVLACARVGMWLRACACTHVRGCVYFEHNRMCACVRAFAGHSTIYNRQTRGAATRA